MFNPHQPGTQHGNPYLLYEPPDQSEFIEEPDKIEDNVTMVNSTTQYIQNETTEEMHDAQDWTTEETRDGTTDEAQDGTTDKTQDGTTDETQDGTTDETQGGTTEDTQQVGSSQETMTDYDLCTKICECTCSCKKSNGKPCSSLFPLEHYVDMCAQSAAMHDQSGVRLSAS